MGESLISVIVPIYNVEKYLDKCILSIINQTYKNLEIILVNDGSNDNCGNICDYYKKIDNRIVVNHKMNEGISSARNVGIDQAKGKLICFVDSDDYLESNYIEELKKNMNKYDSDISVCNYYYIKKKKKKIKCKVPNDISFVLTDKKIYDCMHNKYEGLCVYAWNKLYKKEVFNNLRYPKNQIYEDSYILCEILDKVNKVSYTLKPLYNHVYRNDSIINTFKINHFNKIDALNKRIDFLYQKKYYDLVLKEKNYKMYSIIINLSKMKRYKIRDKEIYNKYYKELVETNNEVKWKDATRINKFYKVFRKPSISMLAFGLRIKDLIKK